jgi:hypothetical protein
MTPETFEQICNDYSCSNGGIVSACEKNGKSWHSFGDYKNSTPEAGARYARAVINKYEYLMAEIHTLEEKWLSHIQTCEPNVCNAVGQVYREKINTLKWLASKLMPRVYGDKIDVTSDGERVTSIEWQVIPCKKADEVS